MTTQSFLETQAQKATANRIANMSKGGMTVMDIANSIGMEPDSVKFFLRESQMQEFISPEQEASDRKYYNLHARAKRGEFKTLNDYNKERNRIFGFADGDKSTIQKALDLLERGASSSTVQQVTGLTVGSLMGLVLAKRFPKKFLQKKTLLRNGHKSPMPNTRPYLVDRSEISLNGEGYNDNFATAASLTTLVRYWNRRGVPIKGIRNITGASYEQIVNILREIAARGTRGFDDSFALPLHLLRSAKGIAGVAGLGAAGTGIDEVRKRQRSRGYEDFAIGKLLRRGFRRAPAINNPAAIANREKLRRSTALLHAKRAENIGKAAAAAKSATTGAQASREAANLALRRRRRLLAGGAGLGLVGAGIASQNEEFESVLGNESKKMASVVSKAIKSGKSPESIARTLRVPLYFVYGILTRKGFSQNEHFSENLPSFTVERIS